MTAAERALVATVCDVFREMPQEIRGIPRDHVLTIPAGKEPGTRDGRVPNHWCGGAVGRHHQGRALPAKPRGDLGARPVVAKHRARMAGFNHEDSPAGSIQRALRVLNGRGSEPVD